VNPAHPFKMKIIVENTTKIVELNGVPARVWEGETDSGIPVHCFITRISPQTHEGIDDFEKELQEVKPPSVAVKAYPISIIL
jgi:hypothetical protein